MPVSKYTFRAVNLRRFLLLAAVIIAAGGAMYALHRLQVRKNADVMLQTARNARSLNKLDDALALFEKYLNFRPKDANALAEYAEVLDEAAKSQPQKLRELFELYERVLITDPNRTADRQKLIGKYMDRRLYTRAQAHLDLLLKNDPKLLSDAVVMDQYGLCAHALGQRKDAIDRYRLAIETGNAPSDTYLRLAALLQETAGKSALEESKKLLDKLLADRPKDPMARMARANYFLKLQQPQEATRELQAAMQTPEGAKSPFVVKLLAEQYRTANNLPAMKETLATAVAAAPENATFRLMYADVLDHTGDRPAAAKQLRDAAKTLNPAADTLGSLMVLDRLIDVGELLTAREEIEKRFAGKPEAEYLQGKLSLATGDWPAAQRKLDAVLPEWAKNPAMKARTHEALGHCARAANNPERMVVCYTAAVEANPFLDSAKLSLAEAQARVGKGSEAAATFRKYAETSDEAKLRYARLLLEEQLQKPADSRNWGMFSDAIGSVPRLAGLEVLFITAERAQRRKTEAIEAAKKLVETNPDAAAGPLALASLQSEADPTAALATITKAEERLGDRVEFRLAKAHVLAAKPKPDVAAIVAIVDGCPEDQRYALTMGLASLLTRTIDAPAEAVTLFRKAAEAKPTDVRCRIALVETLVRLGRLAETDKVIDELRGLDGTAAAYASTLRAAASKPTGGKLAELRTQMDAVLQARPAWGRAALLAAELADTAQASDAALELYRRAFATGERSATPRLVSLLVARRRFDEARAVLTLAESSIGLTDDLRRQGNLLDALRNTESSRVEEFVKAKADSPVAADHVFRGQMLLLASKAKEARTAFEKALTLENANADAWLGLIMALAGSGQSAEDVWLKAKAALSANPDSPRMLAFFREIMGDTAGAEKLYREALKAKPDPAITLQLALLLSRQGRNDDASALYQQLGGGSDVLQRKARREQAWLRVQPQPAFANVEPALAIVGDSTAPDDIRMRGLLLGFDPYRRTEARKLIDEAASLAPPSQDDALRVADFHLRDNDLAKAEAVLRDAARGGSTTPPGLLAILHQAQSKLGKDVDAKETLARLTAAEPNSWNTAVEQARVMANRGDRADAARQLLAHPFVKDPAAKLAIAYPVLMDLGCVAEAEEMLKSVDGPAKAPTWVLFLIGQNRGLEAVVAALALPDSAMKGKLLAAAVLPLPRAKALDKTRWDQTMAGVVAWLEKNPNEWALKGAVEDAKGDHTAAIASYANAKEDATAVNAWAYLLAVSDNDTTAAEAALRGIIAKSGPKPSLLDTLALVLMKQGRAKDAVREIDAALVQSPNKAVYWFHAAQIRAAANDVTGRELALAKSKALNLKRDELHPLEWKHFEKR